MKKIYFVGIAMICIGVAALLSISNDIAQYSNFEIAEQSNKRVKIVGKLDKSKAIHFSPSVDPNLFTFYMSDDLGRTEKVELHDAKPQDFEMSEQIVATGIWQGNKFVAESLLLKCPSKYKDEEAMIKAR